MRTEEVHRITCAYIQKHLYLDQPLGYEVLGAYAMSTWCNLARVAPLEIIGSRGTGKSISAHVLSRICRAPVLLHKGQASTAAIIALLDGRGRSTILADDVEDFLEVLERFPRSPTIFCHQGSPRDEFVTISLPETLAMSFLPPLSNIDRDADYVIVALSKWTGLLWSGDHRDIVRTIITLGEMKGLINDHAR
jgi:hypothetical protein